MYKRLLLTLTLVVLLGTSATAQTLFNFLIPSNWTATPPGSATAASEGTPGGVLTMTAPSMVKLIPIDCGHHIDDYCLIKFQYQSLNGGTGEAEATPPPPVAGLFNKVALPNSGGHWVDAGMFARCTPQVQITFKTFTGQIKIRDLRYACVPEPGSLLALGCGLAVLIAKRRRAAKPF